MKKSDLVQLAFIIAGICSAFFCLDLVPAFCMYLINWFFAGLSGGVILHEFIINILLLAVYLIFCIYSIRHSKQLATWISDKADLQGEINLTLGTRDVLFAFFIGLAVFGLIRYLPWLLSDIYRYARALNPGSYDVTDNERINKIDLLTQVLKTGLLIVLLIYAHVFADFFASKVNNHKPPDEIMKKTE